MLLRYITFAIFLLASCSSSQVVAGTQYVSSAGIGNTTNCTSSAPCPSMFQAVLNAQPGDSVICLTPVVATGLSITKSVDIDCAGMHAVLRGGISGGGTAGVTIDIPASSNDPARTVRLRGISIVGDAAAVVNFTNGIDIKGAAAVYLDDVAISNAVSRGILDERTGGQTKLFVTNSTVRNCGAAGIVAAAAAVGITVLYNVHSENNAYGLAVASGNSVTVTRSVLSGNSIAGVTGDVGAAVIVNDSTITNNNIGVQSALSVRLSNNDISFNATAISGNTGTFGNNRLSGNTSDGTPLTPVSSAQK